MKTSEALKEAQNRGLDLVVISEGAKPPVAKILEYNKFLYEENKKAQAVKAKAKTSELKELRFGPSIGEGDLNQRIERAKEFLDDNNRVRITIRLKGRENQYPEFAYEKIDKFTKALEDVARLESDPKRNGSQIIATFVAK